MRASHSGRGLHNVPAELTSFIGRRRELAEIKQRLGGSRLVTLTGPGGVGKTRLALRAAAELARAFPDGVWFVPLAPIEDPQLVTQAVFHALGLQDRSVGWSLPALSDYLRERHLLLILDNCEHLVDSCAVLATTLLRSCPEMRLLATSRQALGTAGEARMRVPSLSLPEDGGLMPPDRLVGFEAVALLVERVGAVMPGFRVDQTNAGDVLKLCRRLDGIPLALELAAGRMEGLSLARLNEGLDGELSVLGGTNRGAEARQQTLEATIGWSYGLLAEDERRLWARLSVFAGSFDEEAAVRVCAGAALPSERVIELLAALVEKSIVKRNPNIRPARYELLETLRQYGRQRLREAGEEIETQARHRDWVFKLALAVGTWDHRQPEAFNRMYLERNNLWAALDFCLRQPGEAVLGADICWQLQFYWLSRGPLPDARRLVASLLELTTEDSLPRARCHFVIATLAVGLNDFLAIGQNAAESLRIGRLVGNAELVAWSLIYQGVAAWAHQKVPEAVALVEAALAVAGDSMNQAAALGAMDLLCGVRVSVGDPDGAIEIGEEALALSMNLGELWNRGYLLNYLSDAHWQRGDPERAEALAKEGAACKYALDDRSGLAILVDTLAWIAAERGAADRAASLMGCARHIRESIGATLFEPFQAQRNRREAAIREQLGEDAYRAAFERGRAMTVDQAAAYALGRKLPTLSAAATDLPAPMSLTRREQEIAALVADGLSNKQIAAKLVISERTAENHILNILNKLGFNARTQIASWATAHPLAAAPKG